VQGAVRVQSNNSAVVVRQVRGDAILKTSFGMVEATDVGGAVTIDNSNGGVKATGAKGAQVATSFGAVMLDGISGPIQVQDQNGAVEASSVAGTCQPIAVRTSFSTIRVYLAQANYRVTARTSFGKIRTDLPVTVSGITSNDELNGVIGAGACELRLTDNNGAIEILKR
jgi:DUF4097 and DUF4098 domain-containing protein YvlB